MNQISHWLDASSIYGSSEYLMDAIRDKTSNLGLLEISDHFGYKSGTMPICGLRRAKDPKLPICSAGLLS